MQNRVASWIVLTGVTFALATSARAQDVPPDEVPPDEVIEEEAGPDAASEDDPNADGSGVTGRVKAPSRKIRVGIGSPEGPGIALSEDGQSRLHLGIDAGVGFDTNPYSVPIAEDQFAGDAVGRVRPRAEIDVPGNTLSFQARGQLDWGFLPGFFEPETQSFLLYQSALGADLEVARGGPFTFAIGDQISWNNDPGNVVIGTVFNRIHNRLRAGVGFTPGGGALKLRATYNFDFTKWIDIQGNNSIVADGALDNMNHGIQLRADYRFLPKTGVFAAANAGWNVYVFDDTNPMSFPLSLRVGLQGQILAKLFGMVAIGYDNPLVLDNDASGNLGIVTGDVIGVAGQAEVQWLPTPMIRLAGGFQRRFGPAPLYQYVGNNRFYAQYNHLLGGRFMAAAYAGYSILEFGEEQIPITTQPDGRLDGHMDLVLSLSYYITDWFSVGVNNNLDWRLTNAADPGTNVNFSYLRNETLLLASVRY